MHFPRMSQEKKANWAITGTLLILCLLEVPLVHISYFDRSWDFSMLNTIAIQGYHPNAELLFIIAAFCLLVSTLFGSIEKVYGEKRWWTGWVVKIGQKWGSFGVLVGTIWMIFKTVYFGAETAAYVQYAARSYHLNSSVVLSSGEVSASLVWWGVLAYLAAFTIAAIGIYWPGEK